MTPFEVRVRTPGRRCESCEKPALYRVSGLTLTWCLCYACTCLHDDSKPFMTASRLVTTAWETTLIVYASDASEATANVSERGYTVLGVDDYTPKASIIVDKGVPW